MPSPTREERERRIDKDDGALGDTVYVARSGINVGRCYHEDRECHHFDDDDPLTPTREAAHLRDFPPCRYCVLKNINPNHHGNDGPWKLLVGDD